MNGINLTSHMQKFEHNGELLAVKFDGEFKKGVDFLTENSEGLQVGTWWHPKGKELDAHTHEQNRRSINRTQEFVLVYEGLMEVDLYGHGKEIIHSFELEVGEFAILLIGGHGYRMIEDTKVIEVKSGEFNYDDKIKINET